MSTINAVRAAFRTWVETKVRVDAWHTDPPAQLYLTTSPAVLQASTATEYPVESLTYDKTGFNGVSAPAVFTYQIRYRYPGELAYDALPLPALERLAEFLLVSALLDLSGDVITSATPLTVEFPVTVRREEAHQGDWIAYVNLQFELSFAVTTLTGPDGYSPDAPAEGSEFSTLSLGIYRARINDLSDHTLDSTLDLERPTT